MPDIPIHDCQTLLDFSDVLQVVNEMAKALNMSEDRNEEVLMTANRTTESGYQGSMNREELVKNNADGVLQETNTLGSRREDSRGKTVKNLENDVLDHGKAIRFSSRNQGENRNMLAKVVCKKAVAESLNKKGGVQSLNTTGAPIKKPNGGETNNTAVAKSHKGAMWTLWKTRNDAVFNKRMLAAPTAVISKTIMQVRAWNPLLKPKLKPRMEELMALLMTNATQL